MELNNIQQAQDWLSKAKTSDINAFQRLFSDFQPSLRSYLFRLLTSRNDAEDLIGYVGVAALLKVKLMSQRQSKKSSKISS